MGIATLASRMFNGANSFTLIALPMFILAGELMNRGGLTQRIVDFCLLITRPIRGGLGEVNVVASIVFGGITGSSVADTTAIGGIMIPAMTKSGYPLDYSAGVTVASSTIGMVIPPSIPMLVYAVIATESVGALFMSTAIPGLLVGLFQTIVVWFQSEKYGYHPVYTDKVQFWPAIKVCVNIVVVSSRKSLSSLLRIFVHVAVKRKIIKRWNTSEAFW
jgi:tripartite ATP-independent transporter DctM subunit